MDHNDVARPLADLTAPPCIDDAAEIAPAARAAQRVTAVYGAASAASVPAAS